MTAMRRELIKVLRLDLLAAYAVRYALLAVSAAFGLRRQRRLVTMITREHDRPPRDFLALREAFQRADPTIEVRMFARMVPPGILAKTGFALHLLPQLWEIAASSLLIVDGYSIPASTAWHRRGLTIVQTWHALGALKKFGLSILGRPEGRDPRIARALRMHRNYDLVLASAERCREPFAEAFGVELDRVVVAPLPRVDRLRDEAVRARTRAELHRRHPELIGRPIVLYAPTFRMDGTMPTDLVAFTEELEAAGYAVLTKLHPISSPPGHPALRTAPGLSTQELLLVADAFVTDYSSTVFEAAVAGVPAYLFAPDLDQYARWRDFYVAFPGDLGLPLAGSVEELVSLLRRKVVLPSQMARIAEQFVDPVAGPSPTAAADRIVALLIGSVAPSGPRVGAPSAGAGAGVGEAPHGPGDELAGCCAGIRRPAAGGSAGG